MTSNSYNAAGWLQATTDPRSIVTQNSYDALGRTTQIIQDYTNGTPTSNSNKTTNYTYDGDNDLLTLTAVEPGNAHETTQYVYGVTTASGSGINSNDILGATEYPDPSTGNPSTSPKESYTVDSLGETLSYSDRNGNVHGYTYDVLGRQTSDAVTTLGSAVDGTIRRIDTAYDTDGRPYLLTSYASISGGTIVNQVENVYNGLSQLITQYQSVSGAVNTTSTPKVQYAYNEMSNGENNNRLVSLTYPNGRVIHYNYNTGVDDTISRLSSLTDRTGVLEAYTYLGLDTVARRARPQTGVNLTYISPTSQVGDAGEDCGDSRQRQEHRVEWLLDQLH